MSAGEGFHTEDWLRKLPSSASKTRPRVHYFLLDELKVENFNYFLFFSSMLNSELFLLLALETQSENGCFLIY